jgi:hypothetical protein
MEIALKLSILSRRLLSNSGTIKTGMYQKIKGAFYV